MRETMLAEEVISPEDTEFIRPAETAAEAVALRVVPLRNKPK